MIAIVDHVVRMAGPNKSLDASGGSAFLNLLRAAKGALIRAAASTQTFARIAFWKDNKRARGLLPCHPRAAIENSE